MNALDLVNSSSARVLLMGHPGSGKTGTLVSLANAGLKLRVLAFDKIGNMMPLLKFTDRDKLANIDIMLLDDKVTMRGDAIDYGQPVAFANGFKAMDRWTYKNDKGETVDLGASKDWGPDTVVVLDSTTSQGEAAKRRAMSLINKTHLNFTDRGWGIAMAEQSAFLGRLLNSENRFHVIIMSHLKMIGPREIRDGDNEITKEKKLQEAELLRTRLYPTVLGRALPQEVAGHGFSAVLRVERIVRGNKERRIINTKAGEELDIKLPALDLPSELPIEDGLLTVLKALTGGPEHWFAKSGETTSSVEKGDVS